MKKFLATALLPALLLAACDEEVAEVDTSETGGQAAGVLSGGTISDDMLPLEELTSTSPLAPRQSTTTTTVTEGEDGSTTVETTVESSNTDAPAPAPPEPPATPE
ncbi:MAG: hypothetical protein AAF697_06445 [Pseudomonadota bacterium]